MTVDLLPPSLPRGRSLLSVKRRRSYLIMVMCGAACTVCTLLALCSSWLYPVSSESEVRLFGNNDYPDYAMVMNGEELNATKLGDFFCAMFDAGSTGSRVHVFRFSRSKAISGGDMELVSAVFEQVSPGLSHYVDNPKSAVDGILRLLDVVKSSVPRELWESTPMALKATAGLRLLSETKARLLLKEVGNVFKQSPFLTDKSSVRIMDGIDEGIFSWFTVNFLIRKLHQGSDTDGALDLGGASTQVTFEPQSSESAIAAPSGFLHKYEALGKEFSLYTHSYLGLGLMSARLEMMGVEEEPSESRLNYAQTPVVLTSPCIPAGHNNLWSHGGRDYNITNDLTRPHIMCFHDARVLVRSHKIHKPAEVHTEVFYAFSYYYDRAVDAGLIDMQHGGTVKVGDFYSAAKHECFLKDSQETFLCMDLAYISTLLHEGFGFKKSAELQLRKNINGVETSWALGATFRMVNGSTV
ncbi:PREDICTED: ectonucleoside triphosphate diphosphohydrolase 5-like [Priapulus caudatus]|uniref:Ectonucleoside triphosphate diphosphohydrolase 5-like n=1 Tax=Priapulus caudatus TaxID=37621 RepID=A0ABM1EI44_PRICU|nr:PREDICTED: ectonucleoside triphosphate diphosphohydrolase 5-like [Priapulus caudatus]